MPMVGGRIGCPTETFYRRIIEHHAEFTAY